MLPSCAAGFSSDSPGMRINTQSRLTYKCQMRRVAQLDCRNRRFLYDANARGENKSDGLLIPPAVVTYEMLRWLSGGSLEETASVGRNGARDRAYLLTWLATLLSM